MSFNLDDRRNEIEKEFMRVFPRKEPKMQMQEVPQYEPEPWIIEYCNDHVIIEDNGEYFKVPYSLDGDKVAFAPRSEWKEAVYKSEWVAMKAGARNNRMDKKTIQDMHDAAVQLGAMCAPYTKPQGAKATGLDMDSTTYNTPPLAIKIAGDMELDVCYMPYSGQRGGKDADGQYFSPRTNEHAEKYPSPLVLYYHGYEEPGKPAPMPVEIGEATEKRWTDSAGRWMRVRLNAAVDKARTVWESARKGNARASSDSIAHLVRVEKDGEIINWPFVGISLFETETGKRPANSFAFAVPAAKALGISFDESQTDTTDEDIKQAAAMVATIVAQILK